jgi:galactokinase
MLSGVRDKIIEKLGEEGDMYFRRALHPVTENERVKRMKVAFEKDDFRMIGLILSQSHQSLRNNYEVSCKELDTAVEVSHSFGELIGSRMIGGGFGGCTLNLVKKGKAQRFAGLLEEKFRRITGIKGNSYICRTSDGTKKIS